MERAIDSNNSGAGSNNSVAEPLRLVKDSIEKGSRYRVYTAPETVAEQAWRDPTSVEAFEGFRSIFIPLRFPGRVRRTDILPGEVPHGEHKVFPSNLMIDRGSRVARILSRLRHPEPLEKITYQKALHAIDKPPEEDELLGLG